MSTISDTGAVQFMVITTLTVPGTCVELCGFCTLGVQVMMTSFTPSDLAAAFAATMGVRAGVVVARSKVDRSWPLDDSAPAALAEAGMAVIKDPTSAAAIIRTS